MTHELNQISSLSCEPYSLFSAIIEEVAFSGIFSPPSEWMELNNSNYKNSKSLIRYKIRVICDEHYYNSTCTVLCKPRDDYFGHYTCGSRGEKVCRHGWNGTNCDKPICKDGCINGVCEPPGVCRCRNGYKGKRCDECQPYPGCKNGFCTKPWECQCRKNWGGILCDKGQLNYKFLFLISNISCQLSHKSLLISWNLNKFFAPRLMNFNPRFFFLFIEWNLKNIIFLMCNDNMCWWEARKITIEEKNEASVWYSSSETLSPHPTHSEKNHRNSNIAHFAFIIFQPLFLRPAVI